MKNEILALLKKQYPGFVSGEEISISLDVSRTAIWKHIKSLKDDGYEIDSQPRNGYRLVKVPDRLYPQEILADLKTNSFGQTVFYFDSTTSTNDVAKELAGQGFGNGTLIVAEKQEKGKGRMGRNWSSPHGEGLWFSLILRPQIAPSEAHKYTILAGVAAANAIISKTGLLAGIKWPNDILINGRKVCGILTEMNAEMDTVNYIIIGIGINVNTNKTSFPAEIRPIATSLALEADKKISRIGLLQEILRQMEQLNEQFAKGGFPEILARWKALLLTLNTPVTVTTINESYSGMAMDIDGDGALLVKKDNGQKVRVVAGDVTLRKQQ